MQWRINHYLGIALGLLIFFGANYIGFKHYYWKPFAANDYLKFSSQTEKVLKNLPGEVKIYTFVNDSDDSIAPLVYDDLNQLLDQYRYQSGGKVVIKRIDPFIDIDEAASLGKEFNLAQKENAVIVQYQDRNKVLNFTDLAVVDRSGEMYNQPAKITSFKGEQEITSAIQALVDGKSSKLYFLTGHGEYNPSAELSDRLGYSGLATYITRQNVDFAPLNLAKTPAIPADADMLVIAGPQNAYTESELELLKEYLTRTQPKAGHLMLLLDPDTTTGLENLLQPYGVSFDNDLVVGMFQLPSGQSKTIPQAVILDFGSSPIMEWARNQGINLILGPTRSLTVKAGQPNEPVMTPLAITPSEYWGESAFKGGALAYDAGKDKQGPLVVAASIDSGAVSGGEVNVGGMRVVAIGSASFLTNQVLGPAQLDFFLNSMNWMLGKDKALGITPKVVQEFKFSLNPKQQSYLMLFVLGVIPGLGILAGVFVWFRRRK
jgi:ABC-type uncharacterized transport system involved in gliding motility auxiliary subunit